MKIIIFDLDMTCWGREREGRLGRRLGMVWQVRKMGKLLSFFFILFMLKWATFVR